MLYTMLLTIHLFSATLFIGTLFFWTFMIDTSFRHEGQKTIDGESLDSVETLLSRYTRRFMRWNVAVIGLSGFGMLHTHGEVLSAFDSVFAWLLSFKALLGVMLIGLFYVMPYLMCLFKTPTTREKVHDRLHIGMFSAMVLLIILSKWMWVV